MKEFTSINDILDFAIDEEQKAVDFYSELASYASSREMKEVFVEFASEEIKHKTRLLKIREEGIFTMSNEQVADLKIGDYMVNIKPSPNMTYEEALVLAMKKEKSAFKLYALASEESKHKLRFEIEYDDFVLREN